MATTPFHTADALRQRIADAVCHEKIYPAYQPIVCLRTRAIHGLEVLARWHDPDFGAVPPKDFIPIALQASLLVRGAPAFVADTFCASRLAPEGSFNYGALPRGVHVQAIIDRATPRMQ